MKIENIDIQAIIEKAQAVICQDEHMSAATKSMFEVLILIISLLANRLNLNSSKPSSSDPNRKKKPKSKTGRKKGGKMAMSAQPLKRSMIRIESNRSQSTTARCPLPWSVS